ncbi:MAG: DUF115 domain-containing protein [Alphaproteobacteria bacterium]
MRSKNLAFFKSVSPQIAAAVSIPTSAPAFPDWQGDRPAAKRFLYRPPSIKVINRHLLFDYVQDLYAELAGETIEQEPLPGSGYLFLFGCPQGGDIQALIKETPVRGLVLCESDPAAFAATIETTDWPAIAGMLESRSGRIRFVLAKGVTLLASLMQDAVRDRNYGLIDGSFYRLGRPGSDIESVYRQFDSQLPNLATSVGFFEDEVKMVSNVADNMAGRGLTPSSTLPVIARDAPVDTDLTAIVIGSGPSAEETLRSLAGSIAGRAVVLTAGTGLGVALAHGVTPDFHCEIENVDELQEVIAPVAACHDLSSIPLIGPSALSPHTVRFFDTHHCYIREGTCASALYADPPPILHNATPTVANVAARIALALGAKTVLLAGVDFGTADAARHHAESSVYGTVPAGDIPVSLGFAPFDLRVDGNLGEPVLSSQSFMIAAQALGQLIDRYPGRRFLNIGSGALVPGAAPCPVEQAICVLAASALPAGGAASLLSATQVAVGYTAWPDFADKWKHWRDRLAASLSDNSEHSDFISYYEKFTKSVFAPDTDIRVAGLVYGTMMMMFQVSAYLALRMENDRQKKLIAITNRLFRKHVEAFDSGIERVTEKLNFS